MLRLVRFLLVCFGVLFPALPAVSEIRVTYIGNEGFLIEAGGRKVIIDGLIDTGLRYYERAPAEMRRKMELGEPPFDGVDLILVSHHHADHFGPNAIARHLRSNPHSRVLSTPQVIERLVPRLGDPKLLERVEGLWPDVGSSTRVIRNGVEVDALQLHHGPASETQNLGFVVRMGASSWLHVGDTEISIADFRNSLLDDVRVDVAFLPVWYLGEPRWIDVARGIESRAIVAMHLAEAGAPPGYFGSAGSREGRIRIIREAFPGVVILDARTRSWVCEEAR